MFSPIARWDMWAWQKSNRRQRFYLFLFTIEMYDKIINTVLMEGLNIQYFTRLVYLGFVSQL